MSTSLISASKGLSSTSGLGNGSTPCLRQSHPPTVEQCLYLLFPTTISWPRVPRPSWPGPCTGLSCSLLRTPPGPPAVVAPVPDAYSGSDAFLAIDWCSSASCNRCSRCRRSDIHDRPARWFPVGCRSCGNQTLGRCRDYLDRCGACGPDRSSS